MLKEGKTLYQISRHFNMMVKEVYKLEIEYGITKKHKIPRPNKQDLESMYLDEHLTQYRISREFNVVESTVHNWLHYYDIPTRGSNGTLAVQMPPKEVLERMYIDEGMTQYQISREFNVTQQCVSIWFSKYNIPTICGGSIAFPIPHKDDLLNYIAEGLNQHQIAEKYDVCDWKIFDWCEHYGIPGMVNNFRCMTNEHINWRDAVFDRDHRTCQMCGATNTVMHPHHIVPYCDHPEIAYELENGITLCKQCHESIKCREYDYLDQFDAITQPHLRDHEVIESMPWEPPLPLLSDKLFPDYPQEVIA